MKKRIRKITACILAITMVITAVRLDVRQTEAALNLADISTNVSINSGAPSFDIVKDSRNIDGVKYNNYATYKGVTVAATNESLGSIDNIIDGKTGTRWETNHGVDNVEFSIDFGNVYSLKVVDIYWEGASTKNYEMYVSEDGIDFVKLTEVESDLGQRVDELTLSSAINVRAIKVKCKTRTTVYGHSIYEMAFYGTTEAKKESPLFSNLVIKDYGQYTGKYMLYFTEPEDVSDYNVYIDDNSTPITKISGSGAYIDEDDLKNVSEGQHKISVTAVYKTGTESAPLSLNINVQKKSANYNDVAQLYIYTDKGITNDYHSKKDVTITILDENGSINVRDAASNIKIRGNTTAADPKKPWNIKLNKKTSVLGMPKGKKWCVLANAFDKSLMRNRLSYEMGLQIGIDTNCESRIVDVYVNGTFNGNYLITEPVETGSGRVDIDAYNSDSLDILLELGTRNEPDVDHFYTSMQVFDVNEPEKGDDLTDEQVDAKIEKVKQYLVEFENVLRNGSYSDILGYIDEDSFVDFYIVNELFKNVDFNFSSTRFHIKDNTIYAGPMWDLDLSSGNCKSAFYTDYYVDGVSWKGYYCQKMVWYNKLFEKNDFYNKVKERYSKLQYIIQNIYMKGSTQENSIDSLLKKYGEAYKRNYLTKDLLGAGWQLTRDDGYSYSAESGWKTWEEPIEFLRDWLQKRNIWLCSQWDIDPQAAYEASKPEVVPPTTEPPTTVAPTEKPTEPPTTVAPTEPSTTGGSSTETTTSPTSGDSSTETTTSPTTGPGCIMPTQKVTIKPTEKPTTAKPTTAKPTIKVKTPGKTTFKQIGTKKLKSKKLSLKISKVKYAKGYQIKIYKTQKNAQKDKSAIVKKYTANIKFTINSSKIKNKKKLYVRIRAYTKGKGGKKLYGEWSKIKKMRIK